MTQPSNRDPIAIIGIGCRLPGASNPEEFWSVLRDGVDAIGEYPGGRFPFIDRVYAGVDASGQPATRRGGFLRDLDKFDASFFGISPREAPFIDPAQRLLFEVAWEGIEDAGLIRNQIACTRTGVFVGLWLNDYEICLREGTPTTEFYSTIGTGRYSIAGRLSYFFDLRGPSLTVDTACSSSLVAIHMACRSLWSGESDLALAGGSNIILRPEITLAFSGAGMLSPRGQCRFGDADADGYVRSEGAGILLLKPLSRAIEDGDRVYAVIRGGAVNNDGQSSGLLVSPSCVAQTDLIKSALQDARIDASAVDYIEAHGTGTPAGDPVEIEAFSRALRISGRKVLIGSVKTNIGHTEATAGVAGVIKVALALRNDVIPKSLHFDTPNPRINWDSVAMTESAAEWKNHVAGVSGFGITGTNAHVMMQGVAAQPPTSSAPARQLLVLSAHNENALRQHASSWRTFLLNEPSMTDAAYTTARRRTHGEYRMAVAGSNAEDIAERLVEQEPRRVLDASTWKVAFVFSGVGGQWLGMGRKLLEAEPVFAHALKACDAAVRAQGGPCVLEEIQAAPGDSPLRHFEVLQPVLWAMQVSLAELWRSWGVEPHGVVGHSMGEVAAAVISGALTLEEGAAVICLRSSLSCRVADRGLMAVVGVPEAVVEEALAVYAGRVQVAGVNGSTSIVLSGDADAVEAMIAEFNAREVFCRRVNVNVASHSHHMDEVRPELEAALAELRPNVPRVPLYSTVTTGLETTLDSAYWGQNLRCPVLFWPTLRQMIADGYNAFIEISPHPVLLHSIEETIQQEGAEAVAVVCSRRESDEPAAMREAAGALWAAGYPIDLSAFYPQGRVVSLPTYPWQRERFWLELSARNPVQNPAEHLYEMHWRQVKMPAAVPGTRKFGFVGNHVALADALRAAGHEIVSDLRLATEVVHVKSLDGSATLDWPSIAAAQRDGVESLLDTVRNVESGRLHVVTQGALGVPGSEPRIHHATVAGFAGVIRRERPELTCRHIDWVGEDPSALAAALLAPSVEETLAIRGATYWAPRFQRASHNWENVDIHADATYLITGGAGGVGLEIASWMAERGARHVVLTGRRAVADVSVEVPGAQYRQVDVADDEATKALIDDIAATMPPLRGVVHAAGVVEDALLKDTTPELLAKVLAPKAAGAVNLHTHTSSAPLDFFVLCSSMTASLPQPAQGPYSAANAFLDGFAAYRRAVGLPATSIQWGMWSETGLAKAAGAQRSNADYIDRGVQPLTSETALGILGLALRSPVPVLFAAPVVWSKLKQLWPDAPRMFSELTGAEPVATADVADNVRFDDRQAVQDHVRQQVAAVLKMSAANIDVRKPLGTLGLDSLLGLEVVRRLSKSTGVKVPATAVYNHPTVTALAAELARRMDLDSESTPSSPELPAPMPVSTEISNLSEEEALLALMAKSGSNS